MAQQVVLRPVEREPSTAELRHPVVVWLGSAVTLGVYGACWWYFVNREMRDLGESRDTRALGWGESPQLSLSGYLFGFLLWPFVLTVIFTTIRVRRAQRLVGTEKVLSGWVAAPLFILTLGIAVLPYLQFQLNRVWRALGQAPGPAGSLDRPQVPTAVTS